MKTFHNISAQKVSWIKSNKKALDKSSLIENLFYPESVKELEDLVLCLWRNHERFDIIGYSSNTLFLPTYKTKNLICTKDIKRWYETESHIKCECGVNVSVLSTEMVNKGYIGFEGLMDLPGTIAAAVYGNASCRHCSVNEILDYFILLREDGNRIKLTVEELKLKYRSTALKRGELKGVILEVALHKKQGDPDLLLRIAADNHAIRKREQPGAANNLGTTFIGAVLTRKGRILYKIERVIRKISRTKDIRKTMPWAFRLFGVSRFAPYIYYWNRYMFLDERSHTLFPQYVVFLQTIYQDLSLEIEIRD